jgi:hypothetical protein
VTEETGSRLTRPVNILLLFVSALVLVDTVLFTALFFTALTPLTAALRAHGSPLQVGAGIFVAGYPSAPWPARFPEDCSQSA